MPPPYMLVLPTRRHHEVAVEPLDGAVREGELDLERDAAQPQELDEDRDRVAGPAPRPPHPVGAVVHLRVEAAREHGRETRRGAVGPRDAGDVDRAGVPGDHEIGSGVDVEVAQAQGAGEVVAGPGWHDPERDAGARERLDGEAHGPVAARDDDR